jgi:uncharacterized protein (TIGR02391 family)
MTVFPTADLLLAASEIEVERAVLRVYMERTDDQLRRMTTPEVIAIELFEPGGYLYDPGRRNGIDRAIARASKKLEDAWLIEAPDPDNGKNGYRVITDEGRKAVREDNHVTAKLRSRFTREMFHPSLPDAAWNSFRSGDYDTAVFEAFKAVEVAVRKKGVGKNGIVEGDHGVPLMRKAFDPKSGPLTDMSIQPPSRKDRRGELFTGAFGELRNPKAHGDPTITDPLIAVEELMTAGTLQRIVDNA